MGERIVDVFLKDALVASYPIVSDMPISDRDFIDRAKECMRADSYTADDIATAKFNLRTILE